ncbi:MAG: hypothetical protein JST51_15465 [Armatimonadetes bacterium]|nr:hypothetical protein [Armatimonadota bacterium]
MGEVVVAEADAEGAAAKATMPEGNRSLSPRARRWKGVLLLLAGILSAIIPMVIAFPFRDTLRYSGGDPNNPLSRYTFGTKFGHFHWFLFGALLCYSFVVILEIGRKPLWRTFPSAIVAFVLGGLATMSADALGDLSGVHAENILHFPSTFADQMVCSLIATLGMSFAISIGLGRRSTFRWRPTYWVVVGLVTGFAVDMIGALFSSIYTTWFDYTHRQATSNLVDAHFYKNAPRWTVYDIVIGIAMALAMYEEFFEPRNLREDFERPSKIEGTRQELK